MDKSIQLAEYQQSSSLQFASNYTGILHLKFQLHSTDTWTVFTGVCCKRSTQYMLIPNSRLLRWAMGYNSVPVRLTSITQNNKLTRTVVAARWDRILKIRKCRCLPNPCLRTKFCVGSYHEPVELCTKYVHSFISIQP